jgi:hypothetical protein
MDAETRCYPYTDEGLTPQNMRTLKNADHITDTESLHHDVTLMNAQQLQRYMKIAFLETRDETFLPITFWRDVFRDSAPKFFGETASTVGRICYLYPHSNDEADQVWVGYPLHVEYRNNLRSALTNILMEATWIDHPSEEQMNLAIGAVETIGYIAINEGNGQGFPDDAKNQPLFRAALTMIDAMHREPTLAPHFNDSQNKLAISSEFIHRSIIPQ